MSNIKYFYGDDKGQPSSKSKKGIKGKKIKYLNMVKEKEIQIQRSAEEIEKLKADKEKIKAQQEQPDEFADQEEPDLELDPAVLGQMEKAMEQGAQQEELEEKPGIDFEKFQDLKLKKQEQEFKPEEGKEAVQTFYVKQEGTNYQVMAKIPVEFLDQSKYDYRIEKDDQAVFGAVLRIFFKSGKDKNKMVFEDRTVEVKDLTELKDFERYGRKQGRA